VVIEGVYLRVCSLFFVSDDGHIIPKHVVTINLY